MKSRLALFLAVCFVAGLLAWFLYPSAATVPEKSGLVSTPVKTEVVKSATPAVVLPEAPVVTVSTPSNIEAPKGGPVQSSTEALASSPAVADVQGAAAMMQQLSQGFRNIYLPLMQQNDPNTALVNIIALEPQLADFQAKLQGSPLAKPMGDAITALGSAKEALQQGDIEKAKTILQSINRVGPQLQQMMNQAAGIPSGGN